MTEATLSPTQNLRDASTAVASPATEEVSTSATTPLPHRRLPCPSACHQPCRLSAPYTAISAVVAAKDIWKPGPIRLTGRQRRTIKAASATLRSVSAGRSTRTAPKIVAAMMKARWVAMLAPESARYPAPASSAATAAIFLTGIHKASPGTITRPKRTLAKTTPVSNPI